MSAGATWRVMTPGSRMFAAMPSTHPIVRSDPTISAQSSIVMPFCSPTKTESGFRSGLMSSATQRVSYDLTAVSTMSKGSRTSATWQTCRARTGVT